MTPIRARIFALAALLAAFAPLRVQACFFMAENEYDRIGLERSHVADLARAAVTIDWVAIETPPPPLCPRIDHRLTDAEQRASVSPACWNAIKHVYYEPRVAFTARVVEPIKGRSSGSFVIKAPGEPPYGGLYPDQRSARFYDHVITVVNHRQAADSGHNGLALWDRGVLANSLEPSYCPGENGLDPRLRYLAFRNAAGDVLALEPVTRNDDALLQRLRSTRGSGPIAPQITFSQALRGSRDAALVEVTSCRRRRSYGWAGLMVRPLSKTRAIFDEEMGDMEAYLSKLKVPCRVGLRLLVLRKPFDDRALIAADREHLSGGVPDWKDDFALEHDGYLTVGEKLRALPVRNGKVFPGDLITGLTIIGAPISADRALRLGRAYAPTERSPIGPVAVIVLSVIALGLVIVTGALRHGFRRAFSRRR